MRRHSTILNALCILTLGRGDTVSEKREPPAKTDLEERLDAFKNRTIHSQLTPEILAEIPDEKLEQAVIDYIYTQVGQQYDREFEIVSALPEGFRSIHATWWVEAEVNNGGFNQYFWNSTGQFAQDAAAGFRLIGAIEHARLMECAISIYQEDKERLQEFENRGTLEAFSESYEDNPLNELDDKFYALREDLRALRVGFIRANPHLFVEQWH